MERLSTILQSNQAKADFSNYSSRIKEKFSNDYTSLESKIGLES